VSPVYDAADVEVAFGGVTMPQSSATDVARGLFSHQVVVDLKPPKPALRIAASGRWEPVDGICLSRFPLPMTIESRREMQYVPGSHRCWGGVSLRCTMQVQERDTGRITDLNFEQIFSPEDIERAGDIEALVWRFVSDAVMHELAECWMVDGQRGRDPHQHEAWIRARKDPRA
jgi:hypothetical protein